MPTDVDVETMIGRKRSFAAEMPLAGKERCVTTLTHRLGFRPWDYRAFAADSEVGAERAPRAGVGA